MREKIGNSWEKSERKNGGGGKVTIAQQKKRLFLLFLGLTEHFGERFLVKNEQFWAKNEQFWTKFDKKSTISNDFFDRKMYTFGAEFEHFPVENHDFSAQN